MADARSVVELVFQGVDQTGEATQAALNNVQNFSKDVQKLTSPIADATEKALKLEGALLLATGALVGYGIKVAGEFDTAFREIATLLDESSSELGDFKQDILDYAATSTQPLDAITDAIYTAISAGVDYVDSIEFVRNAEELAIAGKADLTSTVEVLVGSLNAFGKSAEEAGDFADILFKAVQDGQTTLPQLANGLSKVTGLAANAGVPMDELAAAISALTAAGMSTPEAMTTLRQLISNIISPSQQAADAADEMGIEFGAAELKAGGLSGVLETLQPAIGGNAEKASDLFGSVQALNGVLVLTGAAFDLFQDALEGQENRTGVVAEAYEDMAQSISLSNQKVSNALTGLFIEIGDPLLEAYGGVAEAIAGVFSAIAQNISETGLEEVLDYIESLLNDTEIYLSDVAAALPEALAKADFTGFINNIEAVRNGVSEMLSGLDLTDPEQLAKALTAVADAFGLLGEFVGGALESFKTIVNLAGGAFDAFSSLDPKLANVVGQMAGWVTIFDKLLPALDTLLLLLIVKQTGGIVGGAAAAAKSVGTLTLALGKLALPLAAGAGIWKIGELVGILWDWRDAANEAALAQDAANQAIDLSENELQKLLNDLGLTLDEYQEFWGTVGATGIQFVSPDIPELSDTDFWAWVQDGKIVANELGDTWVLAADKVKDTATDFDAVVGAMTLVDDTNAALEKSFADAGMVFNSVTGEVVSGYDEMAEKADDLDKIVKEGGKTWKEALDDNGRKYLKLIQDDTDDAKDKVVDWLKTVEDGVTTYEQVGSSAKEGFGKAGDAADEAFEKTEAYYLKMLELAADENIALIEANVQLNVAQLEADTAKVEAAFESINNAISESYDSLNTLFGIWAGTDSAWDKIKLESFIKEEQERLDEQLALQKKLVESEILLNEARIDSLIQGDAQIQIDGAGLQPHLEAFMFEILKTIQVSVNQDGLEQLLGT